MDQTVHVYILHPGFLWYTFFFSFFMRPLTLSYKPAHSLTYSQLLSTMHTFLLPLPVSGSDLCHLNLIQLQPWRINIYEWSNNSLLSEENSRNIWLRLDPFLLVTCLAQHPAVSIWVHRHTLRAEGLLICAIDFLIGSAPPLVNENMLCAGNETWSFLSEMSACIKMC